MKPSRLQLLALSALTLVGFGGIGLLIIVFAHGVGLSELLASGVSLKKQLLQGTIFGISTGFLSLSLMRTPWFEESRSFIQNFVTELNPSFAEMVFYSFCAGVGEELLFRGALQPWLGIWFTAILFIFLHGYLSITELNTTIYGILMVLVSAGFGYLLVDFGLYSAMTAHFWFDLVLFMYLKWGHKSRFTA